MFDLAQPSTRLQRARGRAELGLSLRGGRTRLDHLHQSGCAKLMLPRAGTEGVPEAVFLNTAGGLTGGDRLELKITLGAGGQAMATTQTAERIYASSGGAAEVATGIELGAGARFAWLPQETILYDTAALSRATVVRMTGAAQLVICETLVLGRAAMGETVQHLALSDRREVWRDGQPVLVDPVRIDAAWLARRENPALLGGARAVGMLALVADGAEDGLGAVRGLLAEEGVAAQASAWDGRLLLRALAVDAWPLRRMMVRVLTHLRGAAVPRVWQN
ncbi:urease accessory protein UreD [Tropicimonas sp. IMCC34043]|uniref:urease accessory protein UreD n=1 Tax=Tropicimonas sp. IMCC34043 TaxID=2248760 RepID=UPI000E221AE6|nr:urease accessory protein UreD [Tropicimonas sp. IMCC34043]